MHKLETILLLTGPEEHAALASVLCKQDPSLSIVFLTNADDLRKLSKRRLRRSRLIAFASDVIVPARIIQALGYGAYNFHPGPPTYPGWAPAHFALYEGATEFGTTLHVMTDKVDAGSILNTRLFAIPEGATVFKLQRLAYSTLVRQFLDFANLLAREAPLPFPSPPISWGGRKSTRRSYKAICDIPLGISKEDLDRRMQVFGRNHFGMMPTITLHGVEFRAVSRE